MSKYKLPAVKNALKVLRSNGGGPLTMDEVAALEACATSQAELLEVCKEWVEIDGPSVSFDEQCKRWPGVVNRMHAAIAKAEGRES